MAHAFCSRDRLRSSLSEFASVGFPLRFPNRRRGPVDRDGVVGAQELAGPPQELGLELDRNGSAAETFETGAASSLI